MKNSLKSILILALTVAGLGAAAPQALARDHHHSRYHDRDVRVYYSRHYYGSSYRGCGYGGAPVFYRSARYYPYYDGPRYYYTGPRRVYYRPRVYFSVGF